MLCRSLERGRHPRGRRLGISGAYTYNGMINKQKVQELLEAALEENGSGLFPVSVSVSPRNEIKVYLDGMQGVNIEDCVSVSRYIENCLDRDEEDFELTVSSAGLDQPLRVAAQYQKNKGRDVKVLAASGETFKGRISDADMSGFTLAVSPAGKSKKGRKSQKETAEAEAETRRFSYEEIKETKLVITFK